MNWQLIIGIFLLGMLCFPLVCLFAFWCWQLYMGLKFPQKTTDSYDEHDYIHLCNKREL